jgi:hypothetical protein
LKRFNKKDLSKFHEGGMKSAKVDVNRFRLGSGIFSFEPVLQGAIIFDVGDHLGG